MRFKEGDRVVFTGVITPAPSVSDRYLIKSEITGSEFWMPDKVMELDPSFVFGDLVVVADERIHLKVGSPASIRGSFIEYHDKFGYKIRARNGHEGWYMYCTHDRQDPELIEVNVVIIGDKTFIDRSEFKRLIADHESN